MDTYNDNTLKLVASSAVQYIVVLTVFCSAGTAGYTKLM